ncbi:hypothetical protein CAPTEDRAFT_219911 [Capitella teleta]|uniref:Flavin-containing monooxygenase n=1 Tax=Capitella teleta TaxID=283909 RepID=R7U8U0_CAPTE|nr:hypothetical protein CAPTEDRAFT_219911 [Capitella teleta]|eukprot:ELT99535.1 hypothetical protein CAPTEDRAFT_219911 [Capitella teleta]
MKTTVINTSKEMMCYSDFPADKECPNYMHNTRLMQYFREYAKHFNILPSIRFGVKVRKVKKSSDYDESGKWVIDLEENGEQKTELFDAVLVCTGHHADKNEPSFPGEDKFKGIRLHTHGYRSYKGFEDKRVVVIGIGNSGGDIAVELSKIAKQVYLSTRRGSWVVNRVGTAGVPFDVEGLRRYLEWLPLKLRNRIYENEANKKFNHADYGLKPDNHLMSAHIMVNDELPNRIISGTVVVKHNVEKITETSVIFTDGSRVDDIDIIVYATGYKFGFPFLEDPVFQVNENKLPLFKYMYPPDLKHHTLAVIGYVQPIGAINPIAELQCRLATHIFKGNKLLPSREKMWEDIRKKEAAMAARFYASPRHTIQVDFIPFMDELADLLGCKPNLKQLWVTDPRLAFNVFFGPCTTYQYRLRGPGAWPHARDAILTQWDRIYHPLRETRKVKQADCTIMLWHIVLIGIVSAVIFHLLLR